MKSKAFLVICFFALDATAQLDPVSRSWNEPVAPFKIIDGLYYVGASDVTSFLITTPKGHFLLDGGFEETAPQIRQNIETLGFRLQDVRYLLSSHAHYDHAGGLAELKRATGATFVVTAKEVASLARGGLDDPQFGDRFPFPAVRADRLIADGDALILGGVTMKPYITAGHTRGCTTWQTSLRDGGKTYDVLFLCSPSVPPTYTLINNSRYPDVVDDYRRHFEILKSLKPDIYLGAHGVFFRLKEKMAQRDTAANPFIDPAGYTQLVATMERRFEAMLAEQRAAANREVTRR